ncbi:MAG: cell division protein FtsH, partial [Actinobacteria bacterium]|nr:cell division protein FtsH [Actinomycetota bacterium]
ARAMVTQYGMTESIGAIKLGTDASEPFMGRDYGHTRDFSESVATLIDREIRSLIENAHQEAFDILDHNRTILDEMVLQLLERETLNKEEIAEIFVAVMPRPNRPAWTGSITRKPSSTPPIATGAALSRAQKEEAAKPAKVRAKTPRAKRAPKAAEEVVAVDPGVEDE